MIFETKNNYFLHGNLDDKGGFEVLIHKCETETRVKKIHQTTFKLKISVVVHIFLHVCS